MEYIPIVNRECAGDVNLLLAGPPKPVELHWDNDNKRTQLCLRTFDRFCSWCEAEQTPRSYYYAPCFLCNLVDEKQLLRKAIVQLPLGFVMQGGVKLSAGRWIKVVGLNRPGITPHWKIEKIDQRELEEPVCVLEVLARIKGVAEQKPGLRIYNEKAG